MTELTSGTREASGPAPSSAATDRRAAAKSVREARDRLTSTTGTRPAFDYELLRQFAQSRLSGSLVIIILVGTIGVLSGIWTGPVNAGIWTAGALIIQFIIMMSLQALYCAASVRRKCAQVAVSLHPA